MGKETDSKQRDQVVDHSESGNECNPSEDVDDGRGDVPGGER